MRQYLLDKFYISASVPIFYTKHPERRAGTCEDFNLMRPRPQLKDALTIGV